MAIEKMELKAVGEPDDDPALGTTGDTTVCSADFNFSYARDSNVYVSYVEDKANMIALTQARQMNTTQRMFPLQHIQSSSSFLRGSDHPRSDDRMFVWFRVDFHPAFGFR